MLEATTTVTAEASSMLNPLRDRHEDYNKHYKHLYTHHRTVWMEKSTAALSKCHNTKDKTNFLYCCGAWGNFHETRTVVKLFVYTAKSIEIRKREPALKPHENHGDKNWTIKSDPTISALIIGFCSVEVWRHKQLVTWREWWESGLCPWFVWPFDPKSRVLYRFLLPHTGATKLV